MMTYQPPISMPMPSAVSPTTRAAAPTETRTLLTFPTEGLPSPRIVPQAHLRAFPVRYPSGSPPAQTQINRWLCCRCAEDGYADPVGMVHNPSLSSVPRSTSSTTYGHTHSNNPNHSPLNTPIAAAQHDDEHHDGSSSSSPPSYSTGSGSGSNSSSTCWRPSCRHIKCANCALYAGPLQQQGRALSHGAGAKLLIRTVGGLHASPRFVDPVHWECGSCGEWARNRFDSRCVLGATACVNGCGAGSGAGCGCGFGFGFGWRGAGQGSQLQFGLGGSGGMSPSLGAGRREGERGGGAGCFGKGAAGVLVADSVVMNRYGQRLGTADQRVSLADGPWDWQRRALGDPRCAIVVGLREAMKRTGEGTREGGGSESRSREPGRLWRSGEPVPHFPYRRPPPVDENDVEENNEYEGSYLAGMPTEPSDKGKDPEQPYAGFSYSPRFCSSPVVANAVPMGFSSGWNS